MEAWQRASLQLPDLNHERTASSKLLPAHLNHSQLNDCLADKMVTPTALRMMQATRAGMFRAAQRAPAQQQKTGYVCQEQSQPSEACHSLSEGQLTVRNQSPCLPRKPSSLLSATFPEPRW